MKAILVNSTSKSVSEINVSGSFDSICEALNCKTLQLFHQFENGDIIYIDDEAPNQPHDQWFYMGGTAHPFPANALILGTTDDGDEIDYRSSLKQITNLVTFHSREEAMRGWGQLEWQRIYNEVPETLPASQPPAGYSSNRAYFQM